MNISTESYQLHKTKNLVKCLSITLGILLTLPLFTAFGLLSTVGAQSIGLSVRPPLTEITTPPGETIQINMEVSNLSSTKTVLTSQVKPFIPSGEGGNIETIEDASFPPLSWIKLKPYELGQSFPIDSGQSKNLTLEISIPENAFQKDYYFTLFFSTDAKATIGSGTGTKVKIGSNILLSVSTDEKGVKLAKIKEFSAPRLIDSLTNFEYQVRISNIGTQFFKPVGQIIIKQALGGVETTALAPQNVLVNSTRKLFCLSKEELVPCKPKNKVLIGKYDSTLSFTLDSDPNTIYSQKTTTYAFPFSLSIAFIAIFVIVKVIYSKVSKSNSSR